ncbi:NADPH2:quinone reductase [Tardiphaga sp. OK245]|nr:NADPH2:quinone reductase [Tardiphaga sp. OK245]
MKAVQVNAFGPIAQASFTDVADPVAKEREVVIAVEVAEVNYPDILMMEGNYQVKPPLPFAPGKGAAGRVVALGAGISDLKVGQRVAAQLEYGAFAETISVCRSLCYPVPDGVDIQSACAAVLTYQTAWFALTDRGLMQPGESVLVLGAGGGVGIAAIHLAKALGAGKVIAGTRGTAKAELVRQAGADHVVDLAMANLRDGLRAEIHALTEGRGIDVTIDPVGGVVFEPALRALAWRGRHIVIGFTGGDIPVARTNYLLVRNISVCGLQGSDYRDRWPEACATVQARIFDFIEDGMFKPEVSVVLPMSRFVDALEMLRRGEAQGKILLAPDVA